jgi:hypothetical protein
VEFDEDDDDEDDDDLNDEDSEISVETQLREVDEKSQHNQSIEKVFGIIFCNEWQLERDTIPLQESIQKNFKTYLNREYFAL